MVMIILGNYKNNYDIATKTAQWALTPIIIFKRFICHERKSTNKHITESHRLDPNKHIFYDN